jgi:phage terminase large subunit-like protein
MSTQAQTVDPSKYDPSSIASSLVALKPQERTKLLQRLSDEQAAALYYDWPVWARANQLAPHGDWSTWLILAGRGFGKTRCGAEQIRKWQEEGAMRMALVGATSADVRDVMVRGESGLLAVCPSWNRPTYEPSKRLIQWPNGAIAITYSAEKPDRLRGPQHEKAWCDELCAWKTMYETFDNLAMGLRLADNPQVIVTTTPKPKKLLKELLADTDTVTSTGTTYENVGNVSQKWLRRTLRKYEGTRLGRQELYAHVLDDVPGALWTRDMIERTRVTGHCELLRIVIAVDPAVTSGENSDNTGIVVAGLGVDGRGYVLRDLTCKMTPGQWAQRVTIAYHSLQANLIVAEVNNGGDLVAHALASVDPNLPYKMVHASRGKRVRAEPIASLYEQGRVSHVTTAGAPLGDLEDEMCSFVSDNFDGSPDRVDALVWALTELFLEPQERSGVLVYDERVHVSRY